MTLVENWKTLLKAAWTVQLAYAATALGALGQAMAYLPESVLTILYITSTQASYVGGIATALGLLLTAIIPPARVVDQGLTPPKEA